MTNHLFYLNSGPTVKDLFFKHEGEGVQTFTLAPQIDGLGYFRFLSS
jgi:hypothetical protein